MELNNIFTLVKSVAKQNLISEEKVLEILKEAIVKAFSNEYDPDAILEFEVDFDNNIFKVYNISKFVIEEDTTEYPQIEVPLKEAKKINPNISVGDEIKGLIDISLFDRKMNQMITQLVIQGIKESKKKAIFSKHKSLEGEMVEATVTQIGRHHAVFKLEDGSEAFMPPHFRNRRVELRIGETVKVYVEEVLEDSKNAQIIVSNGSTVILKRLLELEVPEIAEGIVQIVNISRIPGIRSKIAVKSSNENIDAVGTVIGSEGKRIKSIIEKLNGEKIDVILYDHDLNNFVINAIAPAKVVMIKNSENDEFHKIVITPNKHQTLAIGKGGNNAKLVVELTKTRIDVLSIDEAKEKGIDIIFNGNVSEQDLPIIESGEKITRKRSPRITRKVNNNDFDNEILLFNEEYDEDLPEEENSLADVSYEIKEEEIETIQDDFEFGEDFDSADIDEDFM